MKTKEEIKQLAEKEYREYPNKPLDKEDWFFDKDTNCHRKRKAFIKGYTKCQEDMADEIIDFHDWIRLSKPSELKYVGNVNGKCYDYKREYYTTKELYNIYKSLNKQD